MSEIDWRMDSVNIICPYCDHSWQAECEDYSEDVKTLECDECGKEFKYHTQFDVTHHTERTEASDE